MYSSLSWKVKQSLWKAAERGKLMAIISLSFIICFPPHPSPIKKKENPKQTMSNASNVKQWACIVLAVLTNIPNNAQLPSSPVTLYTTSCMWRETTATTTSDGCVHILGNKWWFCSLMLASQPTNISPLLVFTHTASASSNIFSFRVKVKIKQCLHWVHI